MRVTIVILGWAGLLLGCSMGVGVEPVWEGRFTSRGADCRIHFYREAKGLSEQCELIGRATTWDTGFTTDCASDRVREEVRAAACGLGGDEDRAG